MVGRMTRPVPGCGSWTATGMVCAQTPAPGQHPTDGTVNFNVARTARAARNTGPSLGRPRVADDDQRRQGTTAKAQLSGGLRSDSAPRRSGRSIPALLSGHRY
jgi:hypothetical protein